MNWRLGLKRFYYSHKLTSGPLLDCWQIPTPNSHQEWTQVPFLVCDAEFSHLELKQGELLSLGWIEIHAGQIKVSSGQHHLIKPQLSVGQSATIHQLRDCEFAQAKVVDKVLEHFLAAAVGKYLVFHHADLDLAFINYHCERLYGAPLLLPFFDTLQLENNLLNRRNIPIKSDDLTLQACRNHYSLPAYPAHNALVDALATAELFIAHIKHRAGGHGFRVMDI